MVRSRWFVPVGTWSAVLTLVAFPVHASWTQFGLQPLSGAFSPFAMGHLPDGRYVYGEGNSFYAQDAWGSAAYSTFAGVPGGVDPSFIAVRSDTSAVAGGGGFGESALQTFNPSDLLTPAFAATSFTIQNYQGVLKDSSSMYIAGLYEGFTHGVSYVALDGSINKVILTNVSTFSAGFTIDGFGNLYVGDTDDGTVYLFTDAQLSAAISGTPLSLADGQLVYDFGEGGNIGTIAVDGLGRLWAAGYLHNGLRVYDPNLAAEASFIPGFDNSSYSVHTFTRDGSSYVAYINQENPFAGSTAMNYGYDLANNLVVPEPAAGLLVALGAFVAGWRNRRVRT